MYYNLKGTTKNFLHIGGPKAPQIITGTGTPIDGTAGTGINGDLFISQDLNNFYVKRSDNWFNVTDNDLITIAGLTHTLGNVIRSDGTNWQSTTLLLNDLGDTIISAPASGETLRYNGTNWTNQATSGVRVYGSGGIINDVKTWVGTVAVNASGIWSADISSAGFTTIISVLATAEENTASVAEVPLASITTKSTTLITGRTVESDTTTVGFFGGTVEGLEFGDTGNTVHVQVWGT